MLYILFGQDDFRLQETLRGIKEEAGSEALGGSNTTLLEGRQLTLDQLRAVCDTVPFLAPQRLAIVEGLLRRFEREGRATLAGFEEWRTLREYVERMPATTVLVLVDGALRRNNPLLRELSPKAKVREFPFLRGGELERWVRARVEGAGGGITPGATRALVDLIGADLWTLANEIEKLVLYAAGRSIEEEDVRLLVSSAREANVFAMVDAIVQRRTSAALHLLHQLLMDGMASPYLLFMITRQFRLILRAKELKGLPPAEMAARLGLTSDYALDRTREQARRYSLKQLVEIYGKLLEADISLKTGRYGGELALDLLITELCQGK